MKRIHTFVLAAVAAVALWPATPIFADQKAAPDFTIGKEGVVHFNVAVKAGGAALAPGMYQLQHGVEGTDHYVSFTVVSMPAGYRHGNTKVADEPVARVKCTVEAGEKVGKTALALRTNAAGEKEIAEVRIAGEAFKHTF